MSKLEQWGRAASNALMEEQEPRSNEALELLQASRIAAELDSCCIKHGLDFEPVLQDVTKIGVALCTTNESLRKALSTRAPTGTLRGNLASAEIEMGGPQDAVVTFIEL